MNTSERSQQLRYAAHMSWANTRDRAGRTAAARRASHHTRFLARAREEHPEATEQQIEEIAASLKKAHYQQLALRSAAARRIKREMKDAEQKRRIEAELAEYRPESPAA